MENNFLLTDDLLWDYADGFLEPDLRVQVDAYLRTHPEWQAQLDAILAEKKMFSALPLEKPQAGFSDRVMAAWTVEQVHRKATEPGKDWIVRGIAVFFGLFVFGTLIMMIVSALGSAPVSLPVDIPKVPDAEWTKLFSYPAVHYSVYLGLTFLGLRLFEKYLLQKGILHNMAG